MNKPQGKNRNRRPGGKRGGGRGNYDNRNRGNAQQLMDKYLAMARDAASGGDRIQAENYYQHADHYFRVLNGRNDPNRQNRDQNQQQQQDGAQPAEGDVLAVPGSQEAEVVEINAAQTEAQEDGESRPSRSARARSRSKAEEAANDAADEAAEEDDAGLQRVVRTRKPRRKPAAEAEAAPEATDAPEASEPAEAEEEPAQPESIPAE